MNAQYTKQELAELVDVTLDGTGINPENELIDRIIPDIILHQYAPQDVIEVANDKGFRIVKCSMCEEYKANGVWVKPDENLRSRLYENKRASHGFCPEHEKEIRARWHITAGAEA